MPGIQTILEAVETILTPINGVGLIAIEDPTNIDPSQYPYIIVSDTDQREERHGYGGALHQGRKWVYHTITMEIHDLSANQPGAQLNFYQFVDSVRDVLRFNQNLTGVALRFGESITVSHAKPVASVNEIQFNATMTSEALEEIIG